MEGVNNQDNPKRSPYSSFYSNETTNHVNGFGDRFNSPHQGLGSSFNTPAQPQTHNFQNPNVVNVPNHTVESPFTKVERVGQENNTMSINPYTQTNPNVNQYIIPQANLTTNSSQRQFLATNSNAKVDEDPYLTRGRKPDLDKIEDNNKLNRNYSSYYSQPSNPNFNQPNNPNFNPNFQLNNDPYLKYNQQPVGYNNTASTPYYNSQYSQPNPQANFSVVNNQLQQGQLAQQGQLGQQPFIPNSTTTIRELMKNSYTFSKEKRREELERNRNVDPYITAQPNSANQAGINNNSNIDPEANKTSQEMKKLLQLRNSYKSVMYRNDELLPQKERNQIKQTIFLKYICIGSYSFWAFAKLARTSREQGPNLSFIKYYKTSFKYFLVCAFIYVSFNLQIEYLFGKSFTDKFADCTLLEAENRIDEMKRSMLKAKY